MIVLPLGIIAGLLGATLSIEFNPRILTFAAELAAGRPWLDFLASEAVRAPLSFASAIVIAVPIAAVLGFFYGKLLNRVLLHRWLLRVKKYGRIKIRCC